MYLIRWENFHIYEVFYDFLADFDLKSNQQKNERLWLKSKIIFEHFDFDLSHLEKVKSKALL